MKTTLVRVQVRIFLKIPTKLTPVAIKMLNTQEITTLMPTIIIISKTLIY